jgi:DNA-binding NarL/FixJ family response regulator
LQAAVATHAHYVPQMSAPAIATLAELRVRQGRLVEAERLLADGQEQSGRLRALALLRLAEGRPGEAVTLLERAVRAAADQPVRAAQLLASLVDARLGCADPPGAAAAATELRVLADGVGIRLVSALADLASARVAAAGDQPGDAAQAARRAFVAFSRLAMPFDAAQARLELARALAGSAPALARDEARGALAVFRALGAPRAMDVASEVLRALGSGTAPRPRAAGELTSREQEVLELVSLGASNADIAAALCISEKTAGHHVSRILAKLGVRNRTEAAAHAGKLTPRAVAP